MDHSATSFVSVLYLISYDTFLCHLPVPLSCATRSTVYCHNYMSYPHRSNLPATNLPLLTSHQEADLSDEKKTKDGKLTMFPEHLPDVCPTQKN